MTFPIKYILASLLSACLLISSVVFNIVFASYSTQHLLNFRDAEVVLATPETMVGAYPENVEVITIGSREVQLPGYNPSQLN